MKNRLTFFFCILYFNAALHAQTGCEIQLNIASYTHDTLWFGHTVGKRAEPEFFALRQPDGGFLLKSAALLPQGMYALIMKRNAGANYQHTPCWIADGQRTFSVKADYNQLFNTIAFTDSKENEILYEYLRNYQEMTDRLDSATDNWKEALDGNTFKSKMIAETALNQYQSSFMRQYPGTLTAKLVEQTLFLLPPPATKPYASLEAEADLHFQWQKQHFFDRMNLAGDDFLRQPLWLDRTDFYVTKLPPPYPDSMILQLETVFKKLEPNREAYQYYFRYMMNSLSRMSRYRTDEVFVHFVRKYVDKGKANWISESDLGKYKTDATRMEPLFVGKKAPDVTLYDKDNKEVSLYKIESPYTLVAFWRYDCSHCNKEMPVVKRVVEKFQSKGIKVLSVCGNSSEATLPKCWEFVDRHALPAEWMHAADPLRRSRFTSLFNVSGYPRLFLLDADKKILYKQGGEASEETLSRFFEKLMK
ncbi:MAG: TlpA family protein disulfide reductase [Saprospiraceae bacterium]